MKSQKKHAKRQLPENSSKQDVQVVSEKCGKSHNFLAPACLALLLPILTACAAIAQSAALSFSNPPTNGTWLQPQFDLVRCASVDAAKFTSATGFRTSQCQLFGSFGSKDYKVLKRSLIQLREGNVWLLEVQGPVGIVWVPLPWHNWA